MFTLCFVLYSHMGVMLPDSWVCLDNARRVNEWALIASVAPSCEYVETVTMHDPLAEEATHVVECTLEKPRRGLK